jgi:hypothetical protein
MRAVAGFNAVDPMSAAGVSPMAGALQHAPQYYQQQVSNKYLAPMLQQALAQQQQTTQQMQAQTPFAGQMAQAEAFRMLPLEQIQRFLSDPKWVAANPALAGTLRGMEFAYTSRSVPSPTSSTVPTPYIPTGATTVKDPGTGQIIKTPTGTKTWPQEAGSMLSGLGTSIGNEIQKLRSSVGSNTGFNQPTQAASNFASTPGSSTQQGVTGNGQNSLSMSLPAGLSDADINSLKKLNLNQNDLKNLTSGQHIQKNGKWYRYYQGRIQVGN